MFLTSNYDVIYVHANKPYNLFILMRTYSIIVFKDSLLISCVHHCPYSIIIAVNEFFGTTECSGYCNESYNTILDLNYSYR